MTYVRATDPPPRYQWEHWDSEPPNGSINCNATSCTYIVDFYRDATHNINALRRMVGAVDGHTFSCAQVKAALAAYGIPAYTAQLSFAGLKSLLSTGRRPVLVGLWEARVPPAVRGHVFTGMHGVVMLANTWRNGVSGILVMDPNFNPPYRDDPTHGERFYPDAVVAWAMYDYNLRKTSYAVVPLNPKVVKPAPAPVPPPTGFPRTLSFAAGTYTGRQFDANGSIIATKSYTLGHSSSAPASRRSLIKNQTGYWYFVTAGVWAGYWIRETAGIS